jgi:hypothetical protein
MQPNPAGIAGKQEADRPPGKRLDVIALLQVVVPDDVPQHGAYAVSPPGQRKGPGIVGMALFQRLWRHRIHSVISSSRAIRLPHGQSELAGIDMIS